jgi:hypothetical protein
MRPTSFVAPGNAITSKTSGHPQSTVCNAMLQGHYHYPTQNNILMLSIKSGEVCENRQFQHNRASNA